MTDLSALKEPLGRDERQKLVHHANCLRPAVLGWYEAQLRDLQASRDRLIRLASKTLAAAENGTLLDALVVLEALDDEEYSHTLDCTVSAPMHEAFPVDDDNVREEISRLAKEVDA